MRAEGVRIIVISKRFEITEEFHSSKTLLKLAGEELHPPHSPSLNPPLFVKSTILLSPYLKMSNFSMLGLR